MAFAVDSGTVKKGRTSFLKKRSKKLLRFSVMATELAGSQRQKIKSLFASFSSEKEESSLP
jgi:hypothetical protein